MKSEGWSVKDEGYMMKGEGCRMKSERWRLYDEEWRVKDEGWRIVIEKAVCFLGGGDKIWWQLFSYVQKKSKNNFRGQPEPPPPRTFFSLQKLL